MRVTQAYDVPENPLVGTTTSTGVPIYDIADFSKNIKDSKIKTAIISVNKENAQEVADILVKSGIKGILNFSPLRLQVPKDVVVQSIDLTKELQTLLFFMSNKDIK